MQSFFSCMLYFCLLLSFSCFPEREQDLYPVDPPRILDPTDNHSYYLHLGNNLDIKFVWDLPLRTDYKSLTLYVQNQAVFNATDATEFSYTIDESSFSQNVPVEWYLVARNDIFNTQGQIRHFSIVVFQTSTSQTSLTSTTINTDTSTSTTLTFTTITTLSTVTTQTSTTQTTTTLTTTLTSTTITTATQTSTTQTTTTFTTTLTSTTITTTTLTSTTQTTTTLTTTLTSTTITTTTLTSTTMTTTSTTISPAIYLYTSTALYQGNFGARASADAICQSSLSSYFVTTAIAHAFISYSGGDTMLAMPTNYGFPTNIPVKGPSGTVVANDWADLMDQSLDISLVAAGFSFNSYWTGSDLTGVRGNNCDDFANNSNVVFGVFGIPNGVFTTADWIYYSESMCNVPNNILCIVYRAY